MPLKNVINNIVYILIKLKMIWKYYLYDWNTINRKTSDYEIILTSVNWRKIISSDNEQNISEGHWIKVTPTFARSRLIEISGYIYADTREKSYFWINYLDNLFALQDEFDTLKLSKFSLIDDENIWWDIYCKPKDAIEFIVWEKDNIDFTKREFKISLQAPDPFFRSSEVKQFIWKEWIYWWNYFPNSIWNNLNSRFNTINVTSTWNTSSPLKIELKIRENWFANKPIIIKNLTNWTFFWIDLDWKPWDIILIDSENRDVLLNNISFLNSRIEGSLFPTVKGETRFIITDKDDWLYSSDFDIKIYFNDTLL